MKKLLALLLALIMVLSMAACGGNETVEDDDDDDRKSSTRATGNNNENTDPGEDGPAADGEITLETLMSTPASPEEDFECYSYGDGTVQIVGYLGDDDIVVIPDTLGGMPVKGIGKWSLSHDCAIKALKLPDSMEIIEDGAFALNDDLQIIVLGSGTKTLGESEGYVFQNCTALKEVVLNEGLEYIAQSTFTGCDSLESISIPGTVKEVGDCIFFWCPNLKEVILNEGTEKIGNLGSWNESIESVTLPSTLTEIGTCAFESCTGLTSIEIPENVQIIGEKAFSGCTGLTEIVLPDSVQSIGVEAFKSCKSLTEMMIPDGVQIIGEDTFYDCEALQSIRIPASVNDIHQAAFYSTPDELVIIGVSGSYAHQFANGNSITFQAEDGSVDPGVIEPATPEDIILSVDGVETSVIGKSAIEIMDTFGLEYNTRANANIENYPNGVPYYVTYTGGDSDAFPLITIDEGFNSDCTDIYLERINIDFNTNIPEVASLMGICVGTTQKWEVINMFGQPDDTSVDYYRELYWYDVQIGDLVLDYIYMREHNGVIYEVTVRFNPPEATA